ncbi:hypothetical protein M427DRAFT_58538 [Gonapodya prolifera JEL478]|uniref:ARM repeat-containing protein n=1 Tax=Gonapodya prolifera (strain JEL478) TaxID=1344416 RepID=A0A139A9I5_GONPJ|nr:hypothetical protein M427DRAFT_58538 [Gonapodya prolifera JEL478]|eukprot:KXS13482.1 hypothetical protein M427DRAFT_58538 [Gonapodya prolifera JEL478]
MRSLLLSAFTGVLSTLAVKGLHHALVRPVTPHSSLPQDEVEIQRFTVDIVRLMRWFLTVCSDDDIIRIASTTTWVQILRNLTEFQFSSSSQSAKNHTDRLNCLYCILGFVSQPAVTRAINGEVVVSVVRLFVQILGLLQQLYSKGTNGSDFTYKDRSVYRVVALGLRNISRSIILDANVQKSWHWGDHWLFQNDLDWLSLLLNDDERQIQKIALGILGNLILIKGSYQYLCVKIPQFLDMAFSYVLDWERSEGVRKEALLTINNFLITFCRDHNLDDTRFLLRVQDSANGVVESNVNSPYNPVKELLGIFEACGFFDRLREVLADDVAQPEYRLAMMEMLLNLSIVAPEFVRNLLCDLSIWRELPRNLDDEWKHYVNPQSPDLKAFQNFVARQHETIYKRDFDLIKITTLQTIWMLIHGSESVKRVVLSTSDIFPTIMRVLCGTHQDATEPRRVQILGLCCEVLACLLADFLRLANERSRTQVFQRDLLVQSFIVSLSMVGLSSSHHSAARSAIIFISRLLSVHFGEAIDLGLEEILQEATVGEETKDTKTNSRGRELCRSLIMMYERQRGEQRRDSAFEESLQVSLQCLFGKCGFAKDVAIAQDFVPVILDKLFREFRETPVDPTHRWNIMGGAFSLLRHLLAGGADVKLISVQVGVPRLCGTYLQCRNIPDFVKLEVLACVRNLVANCPTAKRALADVSFEGSQSLLQGISKLFVNSSRGPGDLFAACAEILRILVSSSESRTVVLKTSIFTDMTKVMTTLVRSKDLPGLDALLPVFYGLTLGKNVPGQILKTEGEIFLACEVSVPGRK